MAPKDIRKRFLDLDLSEASLARELTVSKQTISAAIHGALRTPWVRRAIAERLGMTYRGMWGEDDPGTARGTFHRASSPASHDASINDAPADG